MRIYLTQYNYTWSLSKKSAIDLCRVAISGQSFDLDDYGKTLKRHKLKYHDHNHYTVDWDHGDWVNLLETLLDPA